MTDAKERETNRRWKAADNHVRKTTITSWPQRLREARAMTDDQLKAIAQGCNDQACVDHGAYTAVLRERANR
jgi:hypothetical protein